MQTGQLDAYRENCRKSLERFSETTDPGTADEIAKGCMILPGSGANLDTVSKMADTAVTQGRDSPYLAWYQFCKGLAEYRQGRFTSAADWMGTVLTNAGSILERDTEAYMVLAMSQHQLNNSRKPAPPWPMEPRSNRSYPSSRAAILVSIGWTGSLLTP